jgi:hypothetical protein
MGVLATLWVKRHALQPADRSPQRSLDDMDSSLPASGTRRGPGSKTRGRAAGDPPGGNVTGRPLRSHSKQVRVAYVFRSLGSCWRCSACLFLLSSVSFLPPPLGQSRTGRKLSGTETVRAPVSFRVGGRDGNCPRPGTETVRVLLSFLQDRPGGPLTWSSAFRLPQQTRPAAVGFW